MTIKNNNEDGQTHYVSYILALVRKSDLNIIWKN